MIQVKDYPYFLVSWEVRTTDNCVLDGDSTRVQDYVEAADIADEHTWRASGSYSTSNIYYCTEDGNMIDVKIHIGERV